jgi:hypothetical protein
MFPAMMILSNLTRRIWRRPNVIVAAPRFDFSDARSAYEQHATATADVRSTRALFGKHR